MGELPESDSTSSERGSSIYDFPKFSTKCKQIDDNYKHPAASVPIVRQLIVSHRTTVDKKGRDDGVFTKPTSPSILGGVCHGSKIPMRRVFGGLKDC